MKGEGRGRARIRERGRRSKQNKKRKEKKPGRKGGRELMKVSFFPYHRRRTGEKDPWWSKVKIQDTVDLLLRSKAFTNPE